MTTTISDSETSTVITGSSDSVLITSSGSLNSGGEAVSFTQAELGYLSNAGQVLAESFAVHVDEDSVNSYIVNQASGSISGYFGVANEGSYTSIHNNGSIDGQYNGVEDSGDNFDLINTGTISSSFYNQQSPSGSAVYTTASHVTIINSGSLIGIIASVKSTGGDAVSITNTGTMIGDIQLNSTNSVIRNSGSVEGDVTFGNGTNSFDGRHGSVSGTITGGGGIDTIRAGNDGETIVGGAGHDVLYGGKGEDTFVFASQYATDTDRIHKFNVSDDVIQLAHSVFTRLTADQTPTFAVGAQASSPTDYLFYNSDTGQLFYDADGSGTKYPPKLIATLDAHLNLTASNFTVV